MRLSGNARGWEVLFDYTPTRLGALGLYLGRPGPAGYWSQATGLSDDRQLVLEDVEEGAVGPGPLLWLPQAAAIAMAQGALDLVGAKDGEWEARAEERQAALDLERARVDRYLTGPTLAP